MHNRHYEYKVGNKNTEPIKVKLPSAEPITQNLKTSFDTLVSENKLLLKEFTKLLPNENE